MHILIFRHGIAEDAGPDGNDALRALTPEGIDKARQAAVGLAKLTAPPDAILTSPKVRAAQTADILAQALGRRPQTLDALASGSASRILQAISGRHEDRLLLVGHEPTLSQLVERLCTQGEAQGFIELKKAGCACVEVELQEHGVTRPGRLVWLATSKMLRAMAS